MIIKKSCLWFLKQVCFKKFVCISVSFVNKICRLKLKFRQNSLGLKGMKSGKAVAKSFGLEHGLNFRLFQGSKWLCYEREEGHGACSVRCVPVSSLKHRHSLKHSFIYFFSLHFNRERHSYFREWMNLFDWLGLVLILCIIPLRYTDNKAQWKVASLAFLFNFLRIFKFSCVTR